MCACVLRALRRISRASANCSAFCGALCLGMIPICVLVDLLFRKIGLSVVIGLERLEYLLAASVLLLLPKLSVAALNVTLEWTVRVMAAQLVFVRVLSTGLCIVVAFTFMRLGFGALESGAMFRSGLEIAEAPVWFFAALSFFMAGVAEAIGHTDREP